LTVVIKLQHPQNVSNATLSETQLGVDMMRRFLLSTLLLTSLASGPVAAADMAVKALLVPAAVAYNWSGIYIGGTIGGVWTEANRFMPDLPLIGVPPTTFTAHSTDGI
jgi:outer membrane immunogenic protein